MDSRTCTMCGRTFETTKPSQKYCLVCQAIVSREYSKSERNEISRQMYMYNYAKFSPAEREIAAQYPIPPHDYAKPKRPRKELSPEQRERAKARSKVWRENNFERRRESDKVWSHSNPEKTWHKKYPEKCRLYRRKQYLADPAKAKAYAKQWSRTNHDKILANHQAWAHAHPEKMRLRNQKIAAKRRNLKYIPINELFEGCEGHHLNDRFVIYIPKRLHKSVGGHNQWTGFRMQEINELAFAWMVKQTQKGAVLDKYKGVSLETLLSECFVGDLAGSVPEIVNNR